ncbi:MAG: hypothetical protein WC358_03140 [Ignavibacteria bacterium]|jgi:uncharacterized membrane protein YphA (DoxX/SURF4 family)
MSTTTRLFAIVLSFVLFFGIFFTGNSYASNSTNNTISTIADDDGVRSERVCINGIWYIIIYDADGGIVEVIIDNND